jgi:hypothetical protein
LEEVMNAGSVRQTRPICVKLIRIEWIALTVRGGLGVAVPVTVVGNCPGFGPPHVNPEVAVPPARRVMLVGVNVHARPVMVDRPTVPVNVPMLDTKMVDVAVEVPALDTRVVGFAVTLNRGVVTE